MTKKVRPTIDTALDKRIYNLVHQQDTEIDVLLLPFDIYSSVAHAYGLKKAGYLTPTEFSSIQKVLRDALSAVDTQKALHGSAHEVLEHLLHAKLGALGDKLQLGRSRYNQLTTAFRLYAKKELLLLRQDMESAIAALLTLAERYAKDPIPGFTHGRMAEVSSVGHLFGGYAEALLEEHDCLLTLIARLDQSPLGAGTAYGSTLVLDRDLLANLMGFSKVQNNTLGIQLSRGRLEAAILSDLVLIAQLISRFASDLILFSSPQYGFFDFNDTVLSKDIMIPKKRNPVIFEILRGSSSITLGALTSVVHTVSGLPAGYQRDLQLTKEPVIRSLSAIRDTISVFPTILNGITINTEACREAASNPQLFASDLVTSLVLHKNLSLEKARAQISANYDHASFRATLAVSDLPDFNPSRHLAATSAPGMPGNAHLASTEATLAQGVAHTADMLETFEDTLEKLWQL